ncbi:MAG: hypothetical protein GF311_15060 [Candidatus Lokiarchaeota archaeon]|nr:hypothetical protein [Candidatus Lokiarchaeota archaeon]
MRRKQMSHNNKNNTVVMFSGGVDSLIAWLFLDKPKCVHINLHVPYAQKELETVKYFSQKFNMNCEIVDIASINSQPLSPTLEDPFIPSRNLLLAIIGSWFGERVCVAGVKGDLVEDKSPQAYEKMSELLTKFSRKKIEVFSPFWEMTKGDIIEWYVKSGEEIEALHRTVGCYHPALHQCGECGCCFRKWTAFKVNNIQPLFEVCNEIRNKYRERALSNYYDEQRNREILKALGENYD